MLFSSSEKRKRQNKTHPRAQVARAEDVVDPSGDEQRPEAGRERRGPVRDVEVADAEDEHHGGGVVRRKREARNTREKGNAKKRKK